MEKIFQINPTVLGIQAVSFFLLLLVFRFFLFGPLMDVLRRRQEDIRSTYDTAESEKAKMEALRQEYEQRMLAIESEAREKMNIAIKEGQAIRDDLLAEARAKADEIIQRAEAELVRERDKALQELREEVVDIAVSAASKLIEQSLDEAAHRKLVASFIQDLEVRK